MIVSPTRIQTIQSIMAGRVGSTMVKPLPKIVRAKQIVVDKSKKPRILQKS